MHTLETITAALFKAFFLKIVKIAVLVFTATIVVSMGVAAQDCEELNNDVSGKHEVYLEKLYRQEMANYGINLINQYRLEYKIEDLLTNELESSNERLAEQAQAVNQAKNNHDRSKEVWAEDCSES